MRNTTEIKVSFCHETFRPRAGSVLSAVASGACGAVTAAPFNASALPFFDAAKACDWLVNASEQVCAETAKADATDATDAAVPSRLRAIQLGDEVLLEHSYAKDGRLATTRFVDGSQVDYEYHEATRTVRVLLRATASGQPERGLAVRSVWTRGRALEPSDGVDHADALRVENPRSGPERGLAVRSGHEPAALAMVSRQIRVDGSLESCEYAGGHRFDYANEKFGGLARIEYPDKTCVAFTRTPAGALCGVETQGIKFDLGWSSEGELERCAVEGSGAKNELRFPEARSIEWPAYQRPANGAMSHGAIHPLGVWIPDDNGGLSELISCLGERWVMAESGRHGPRRVWSAAGQTGYEYDDAGVLSAVIGPDGSRSVFHRVRGQQCALLVSPGGVTLFTYDDAGRLRTTLETSGAYSLLRPGRGKLPGRIDTLRGTTKLNWNREQQLTSLTWPDGMSCDIDRAAGGGDGGLERFVVRAVSPNAGWRLTELASGLWSWLAARPALRLEDAFYRR